VRSCCSNLNRKSVSRSHQMSDISATTSRRGRQAIALCSHTSKALRSVSASATMLQAGGAAGNRPQPSSSGITGPGREQACRSQLGDRGYARFEALKKAERQRGQSVQGAAAAARSCGSSSSNALSPCLQGLQPRAGTFTLIQTTDLMLPNCQLTHTQTQSGTACACWPASDLRKGSCLPGSSGSGWT
jgi:hypothetical protein